MKMIILILKDNDSDSVTQALTAAQYRVTRVASTGGFLRSGVVTLLLGVLDERLQGFGNCGNHYECQAACPKGIKVRFIAKLNREFMKARTT